MNSQSVWLDAVNNNGNTTSAENTDDELDTGEQYVTKLQDDNSKRDRGNGELKTRSLHSGRSKHRNRSNSRGRRRGRSREQGPLADAARRYRSRSMDSGLKEADDNPEKKKLRGRRRSRSRDTNLADAEEENTKPSNDSEPKKTRGRHRSRSADSALEDAVELEEKLVSRRVQFLRKRKRRKYCKALLALP